MQESLFNSAHVHMRYVWVSNGPSHSNSLLKLRVQFFSCENLGFTLELDRKYRRINIGISIGLTGDDSDDESIRRRPWR